MPPLNAYRLYIILSTIMHPRCSGNRRSARAPRAIPRGSSLILRHVTKSANGSSIYFNIFSVTIYLISYKMNTTNILKKNTIFFFIVNRWSRINTNASSSSTGSRTVPIRTSDGEPADGRTDPSSWRLLTTQRSPTFCSTSSRPGNEVVTTGVIAKEWHQSLRSVETLTEQRVFNGHIKRSTVTN